MVAISLLSLVCISGSAWAAASKLVMLDKTDTTDDWIVNTDLTATGYITVTDGPEKNEKAVRLIYDLSGGKWVNLGKEYRKNIAGAKALVFWFKSQGPYTLEIKIADLSGTTYGIKIPGGTDVPEWRKFVVPLADMTYLWGGTSHVLDLQNIRGIDFAASVPEEGNGGPGNFMLCQIQYSLDVIPADLPKPKKTAKPAAPVVKGAASRKGKVDIGGETDWRKFSDKGASVSLAFGEGPTKEQRSVQANYTWGQRKIAGVQEETGTWVAFNRDINMDLSEMRNIVFMCKGTGAIANVEVKVIDKDNCTYGKSYSNGSSLYTWSQFVVSRSDLNYMWGGDGSGKFDWSNVARLEIALSRTNDSRDTGSFAIADIRMESAVTVPKFKGVEGEVPPEEKTTEPGRVNVTLDDFTDLNPTNRYYVEVGDDSTLQLFSSRVTFETDYSMDLRYQLLSNRPTGSWVQAERRFSPPLNWTGAEELKVWVRGDSSKNILRFTVIDGDNNLWVADNKEVLVSGDWFLVTMPMDSFTLYRELDLPVKSNKKMKDSLNAIQQLGIGIVSQPDKASRAQGEIYIENLYLVGRGLNKARAVPMMAKAPIGLALPLKNWNIGGTSETFLDTVPNTGSNLTQNLSFKLTGNFEKFSVLGEIRLDSTFGNDPDTFRSKDAVLAAPNLAVTLLNPLDGVSDIMLGNLWFNANPNIFANDNQYGGWDFKGMLVEGWLGKINHHTYFIKNAPESYTLAGQYGFTQDQFNASLIGTYYNDEPFIMNATRKLWDDSALLADLNQKVSLPGIFDINLRGQFGYDWYQKYWDSSTQTFADERDNGALFMGELNFAELSNIFWPGLSLTGQYRYVDTNFKPVLRQAPGYWDMEFGDQKGYLLRLYQSILGMYLSAEYLKINRLSTSSSYREGTRFSVGYNNWSSMDLTVTEEFWSKVYNYSDPRYLLNGSIGSTTPGNIPALLFEDWRETDTTLYAAYHLSGNFLISENIQFKDINRFDDNTHYTEMYTLSKVAYYPAPNLTFSIENKFSRFGRQQDVPVIDPNNIYSLYQYTWVKLDLTF
jgi:hypothetical protein